MVDQKFPMTPQGYQKLCQEGEFLKTVERPRIIQAIADARRHGDLSENAEYHAAKEQQRLVEDRISDIEKRVIRADVIEVKNFPKDKVVFGTKVEIVDEETDRPITYKIVGEDEADIKQGLLSIHSPLARSLVGKSIGDSLEVHTPGGVKTYEILQIST